MYKFSIWILKIFLIISPFPILKATENLNKPFVTCWIGGQLGNQLFQIASTLAYSWDYDAEAFFPELDQECWNISYNQEHFFFRLNNSTPPRPILNEFIWAHWWEYTPVAFQPDQRLVSHFYLLKYFHHHYEKLVEVFAPSEKVQTYLQQKYEWVLNHPRTVSVHVRTYNEQCNTWFPFVGLDYYEKAMNFFPDDTLFVVFSDRINWCKHHFSRFNKNIIFAEGNDHIQDFFLMSSMKSHILANSSYSWWAAYLNNKPEKIVVAPRYWYRYGNPNLILFPQEKNDFFLHDWILISSNLDASYPTDMKLYDTLSQSIDNQ